jgi:hypothetical protein
MRLQNKRHKINVFQYFSTMAKNNITMLQQFVGNNVLLKNMDVQTRHLIINYRLHNI